MVPVALVGLILLRFNAPLTRFLIRTTPGPRWQKQSHAFYVFGRVCGVIVGAGWLLIAVCVWTGALKPN